MSKESHRQYLEAVALREAQKALVRNPETSRNDLLTLKIQTIEPYKRIMVGALSLSVSGVGIYLTKSDHGTAGPWFMCIGVLGLLFSIFGWRRTLDGLSGAIDMGEIFDALF